MPNNAEARRVKDKKKKDKGKKTEPFPLHKEDKASVDTPSLPLTAKDKASADSSSSLSLEGIHEAPEAKTRRLDALREKHVSSLSQETRLEKIAQLKRGNPGASEEEIRTLYRAYLLGETLKEQDLGVELRAAKRRQATNGQATNGQATNDQATNDRATLDSFFLSYAETDIAALLVPGHEQNVFAVGYTRALPEDERVKLHIALTDAHPNVPAKDMTAIRRPLVLKAGLEALKAWRQEANKSLSSEEKKEQDLTLALKGMEKAILVNANAVHEDNAYWSWAKTALLSQHSQSMTMEERKEMRKRFQEEIREENQSTGVEQGAQDSR